MIGYLREFSIRRRALAAAFIGMASGYTINNYLNNLFIPVLMRDFGWRSEQVALVSTFAVLSIVCQPLAGRLTDRFGVRPVAFGGTLLGAAIFLAFSAMKGAFWVYAVLVAMQIALVASTTAAVVYSRPVAQSFTNARGLALALAICAPSLLSALAVPSLTTFIDAYGWRSGFRLVAVACLFMGLFAVWLSAPHSRTQQDQPNATGSPPNAMIGKILSDPNYRLILMGMALGSLSIAFQTTQLKVVLLNTGLDSSAASALISVYALGVIFGRLASGLALDLLPTRFVATCVMALPGLGLMILAQGTDNLMLLHVAMLSLGFSLGAEGDVAAYLVITYLPLEIYSTAYGLIVGSISAAAGVGALLLSGSLSATGTFAPFLCLAGVGSILSSAILSRLRCAASLTGTTVGDTLKWSCPLGGTPDV